MNQISLIVAYNLYDSNLHIYKFTSREATGSTYFLTVLQRQIMAQLFLTVQGGGIQSKTYLTSSSYSNKILHQTSPFLNENHF